MPQQVPRLLAVLAIAAGALLLARRLLIPETFGDLGHYRAAALDTIAARPIKFAGRQACAACHGAVDAKRVAGNHRGVACEICHGPAAAHAAAPMAGKPEIRRERALCLLCHAFNPSRPTGFPQVDSLTHNARIPCMTCHQPHAPEPPVTPRECSACHGGIARQKAVSHHATLPCTTCHEAPETHRQDPRSVRPTKPTARAFCGGCHSGMPEGGVIPQIDLQRHGQPYLCWQCHYPHHPEAGT
ncbi:MAG: hypothetical protein OEY20_00360 [Gemmatimonadota bacterium]|nr:hypothetical protein [Gemmatimonadota bacterium]MDH5195685.1 hypothetical protein [Gemmatimonadota bacterium]